MDQEFDPGAEGTAVFSMVSEAASGKTGWSWDYPGAVSVNTTGG